MTKEEEIWARRVLEMAGILLKHSKVNGVVVAVCASDTNAIHIAALVPDELRPDMIKAMRRQADALERSLSSPPSPASENDDRQ